MGKGAEPKRLNDKLKKIEETELGLELGSPCHHFLHYVRTITCFDSFASFCFHTADLCRYMKDIK